MRVRTRIGDSIARVAKTFGTSVPESFREGEAASQMTPASPFSPGAPIGPYDGYDRFPRSFNFTTGYNISTRPRLHEAVSFSTLQGLIGAYDVADICIWHRIDSIRSLKFKLLAADHYFGDVTDAIPLGMAALKKPDRKSSFKAWLAKYLYDILAYDAGTLYRMRNRGGRCIGLKVVDGTSIAPLLDYWGDPPDPPAESHVQYVNGLPWNWLTRDDIIYEPFRPRPNSPYGHAPIESIILNANTDIRFQVYFLQRFTDGNLPAAFAAAPESWSPDQIEQFQAYWDAMMFGDQSRKHQIRWMPPGSKFEWSNEKEFSDVFSLFMMRKTCSAYHVVPSDLGFTENVNRSSGESQADVQHRVGDLPLMEHVEEIISMWLQDDLGLPLKHEFDRGEEQVDQLAQAEADQKYMDRAVVSPSEIRELRYGLSDAVPVPRSFFSERAGPIPVISLMSVAGPVDPQTAAPEPGATLPHQAFTVVEGVVTSPPLIGEPLAEQEYGPAALPPGSAPVAKEGEGAPAAGITSETGVYSYDLEGRSDEEEPDEAAQVAKELAAFRRFEKARRRSGEWRDFEFRHVAAGEARRLNEAGRSVVRKDAATPGLTSRSGMISLDLPGGTITPVPGGLTDHHVTVVYLGPDVDDDAYAVACQRAASAAAAMPGPLAAEVGGIGSFPPSGSSDGKVPAWAGVVMPGAERLRDALADLSASEHTDWKPHVTLAYVDPGDPLPARVPCTPVTFTHLSVHRGDDIARFPLGAPPAAEGAAGDCCGAGCCSGDTGCCGGLDGCQCGPGEVAKAAMPAPKVRERPGPEPVWGEIEQRRAKLARKHLKAVLAAWNDCTAGLSTRALVSQFRAEVQPVAKYADPNRDKALETALAWLAAIYGAKGYAALVAAISDAIRSGMAEGEADALAVAAARSGAGGIAIDRAFADAYERLADGGEISRQAADVAGKMISGAAADVSRVLAEGAADDSSDDEASSAVDDTVTGNNVRSVSSWLQDAIWGAIGAGAVALFGRASQPQPSAPAEPGEGPAVPPSPPEPPGMVLLIWVTDGNPCKACMDNEAGSPYAPQDLPSFPQHNHCQCEITTYDDVPSSFFAAYLLN